MFALPITTLPIIFKIKPHSTNNHPPSPKDNETDAGFTITLATLFPII